VRVGGNSWVSKDEASVTRGIALRLGRAVKGKSEKRRAERKGANQSTKLKSEKRQGRKRKCTPKWPFAIRQRNNTGSKKKKKLVQHRTLKR